MIDCGADTGCTLGEGPVWDAAAARLVNLMPAGEYLMEDFYYAGGLPPVMRELADLIEGTALTVSGSTIAAQAAAADEFTEGVIRPLAAPFKADAGIAVLRGTTAPPEPSSSRPPPRPSCYTIGARRWYSSPSRTSSPASTTSTFP